MNEIEAKQLFPLWKWSNKMNDNIVNEIYEKEVISTIVSNVKRLLQQQANGSMELNFKGGMLNWVDIRTDKQSTREVL